MRELLNKCDHINDFDIMDILKEFERWGQPLSRKEIEYIFED